MTDPWCLTSDLTTAENTQPGLAAKMMKISRNEGVQLKLTDSDTLEVDVKYKRA